MFQDETRSHLKFYPDFSMQLHDSDPAKAARNMRTLVRMVKDGHVLADHSYDHMKHNSNNSPR